jgi:hypothetical protein
MVNMTSPTKYIYNHHLFIHTPSDRDRIGSCGYLSQIQCRVIPIKNDNKRMTLKFNDSAWTIQMLNASVTLTNRIAICKNQESGCREKERRQNACGE